jgi:dTDP-4-amino-4,6-dideoxygalactose transaminase
MQIPFVDLKMESPELKKEISEGIESVIASSAFAGGRFVAAFEEEFARYCDCEHAIGVGNGTDAIWLALLALGVGPGDEVITVANTFFATAEAISMCGATPVFVDIDERLYNMDPDLIERAITSRTKAIIPVHLYGQPADMDPIIELAKKHNLQVVEDACQAHGATYKGRKTGSLGIAGCFSFYPTKNLGAFGEAGAVVTNDAGLKERIACLRDHGQAARYRHDVVGWNARMDGIQAAVLTAKLKRLDENNQRRAAHADRYRQRLNGLPGIQLPYKADYATHVYHLFVIRVKNGRTELMQGLSSKGIGTMIHYPIPVHLQKAYRHLGYKPGSMPVTEACVDEIVSLPMFPELRSEQVDAVACEIEAFCSGDVKQV